MRTRPHRAAPESSSCHLRGICSGRMLAFLDAVGGSGVRSPRANASLDGGDRTGGPQDPRFSIALPYLRSVPFRRLSCAGVCVNRDAWTPFLLAEQACVSRKRVLNGQPESLSDLPRYQGVVRVLLHALGHRGGCLQDRGRASRPTAAGVAGDGARGRGLPLRGSDRCVCRHLRPAAVGYYRLHTDGMRFRVRGCHPRIHSRARRPGGVGCRVHVHQRALEAWIADEDTDRDLGMVYLRGEQADYFGSFVGIPASVLLGLVALNLPLIVGGVLTITLG